MTEAEGPVHPELEVTAEELEHVRTNVYDHTVLCLPAAYVRAVPGLVPNVSGGYVRNSDDPRVSDVKTLWVGRAAELAAAMGKFKAGTAERRAEAVASSIVPEPDRTSSGDGVAAVEFLANVEPKLKSAPSTVPRRTCATSIAKPAVVFVSGSSGVAGDTLRYLRILAAEGHLVLCPDDFCGWPPRLRHRTPRSVNGPQSLENEDENETTTTNAKPKSNAARAATRRAARDDSSISCTYWSRNLLYEDGEVASGELVYESSAEQYTSSDRLAMVYDTTLAVKHAALTKLLLDLPTPMARRGIYLAGNSEGAIVLGMMDDAMLDPSSDVRRKSLGARPTAGAAGGVFSGLFSGLSGLTLGGGGVWEAKLLGRINIAYSLEPNYFTYRTIKKSQSAFPPSEGTTPADASAVSPEKPQNDVVRVPSRSATSSPTPPPRGLFGSRWRRDVPTLCVNGSADQFFGRRNSISEKVVHRSSDSLIKKGDRPNITGDAGQRIAELGMSCAFVVQMEGAKHAMCATHDAALRETLSAFLEAPKECVGIPDRWEREDGERERLDRTVLWHGVVAPGKCSFASIAATEIHGERDRGGHFETSVERTGPAADRRHASPPDKSRREDETEKTKTAESPPRGRLSRDVTPASSRDASMHGSASFLDLTSSLARLVRPASWSLLASPRALGKPRSRSLPWSSARSKHVDEGPHEAEARGGPETEHAEHAENVENVENVENAENAENVENAENAENVENVENVENAEHAENAENAENVENAENAKRKSACARPTKLFARLGKWTRKKIGPRK